MKMEKHRVSINVNGKEYSEEIEPRTLLVTFLRDIAGLTGTHIGCDTSNCGACTVILNGRAVKSCTVLAVQASGSKVLTIYGLSKDGDKLHPIQKAFIEKKGYQCGYCTSGMILTALALLNRKRNLTEDEIREALSGNLCRCTGYDSIIDSIMLADSDMAKTEKEEEIFVEA